MNPTCKICGESTEKIYEAVIRGKHTASYFQCQECEFVFIDPVNWLEEAYREPINASDTGYVSRNISLSRKAYILFRYLFNSHNRFLDYAGGHGMLVRLMRDYGLDFYWEDKYAENIFARGFEYEGQRIEAATCFECLEHLADPNSELKKIFSITGNLLFSTELLPENRNDFAKWTYLGVSHGQHISFYSLKTLRTIAMQNGLNLYSNGKSIHLITSRRLNPVLFKILLKLGSLPWDSLARFWKKCKTLSDSQMLIEDAYDIDK